jgi:Zn-dependent membrane protease YugP
MRSALVPVVSFSNNIVMWVIMAGLFVISVFPGIFWAGVGLFAMSTLFSLVTLPVELNASHRAVSWLRSSGVADAATLPLATDALKWAAYTYVIAALGSLAILMYYISLGRGRD